MPLSTTKALLETRDTTEAESTEALSNRPLERSGERILYVDDEEIARETFADAAIQLGFRVDTADGGGEALAMASRHRYAVIAADLRMPTLNGLSLIQLLRPQWPHATYLIVTGASLLDLPTQANGEPLVDEILSKPWTVGQLARILKRAIDRARHRRSHSSNRPQDLPILVVEDDPETVDGLRQLMAESLPDTSCLHAQGLSHAIEMLAECDFQLAVVDLELADSGGLEMVSSLRRTVPELPLIVLGVLDDVVVENQVLKAGAQDYLVKGRLDEYNLRRSVRYALERKHIEDRLTFVSQNDGVTGLPNRTSLLHELGSAVGRARSQGTKIALLLLDLDRFKIVNDSLGHNVGDRLLAVVAERLHENLRDVDVAARLGGDEFAILLEGVPSDDEAVDTATRLLEALTPPARLGDYEIVSTGSIGVALYPDHAESATELLQRADRAMYRAKQNGRDGYAVYSDENEESASGVLERLTFESGIRHALERDEYVVFFQPQMTLDRKRLVAVEALVRWNHPKVGLVPPGQFMPFLESSGLIKGVGDWVLQTACHQVKLWQDEVLPELRISVNLSARQFEGTDLVSKVERALSQSGLSATDLELEITESLLMRDTERTRATLQELKALGVRIAIDDFGTGYSSLAYLTTFPLDCLKIDRSFVHDITTNDDDRTVAEAIIGLGHNLRLDVVAEGVETEEQLAAVDGCDGFQGFLISRPQPAEAARDLLQQYAPTS